MFLPPVKSSAAQGLKVSFLKNVGYGAGNLSFAVAFQCISGFFYFYCTAVLKLPPGAVGLAVGLSVIWDAVTDPVMGYVSDHTRLKRLGRRHFYLLAGAAGTAVSNYLLWTIGPNLDPAARLALAVAYLFLCKTFITVYATPYNALGAELSGHYEERTSIQAVKTAFFILGFLFSSVAGMLLFFRPAPGYPEGQFNPDSYSRMGLSVSLLTLVFAAVCFAATSRGIPSLPAPPAEKGTLFGPLRDMAAAVRKKDFRNVVVGYLFINVSSSLLGVIGLHVMTYTYALDNTQIALIFGGLFGVAVLSQPLWHLIAAKKEKKAAVLIALRLSLAASALFLPTVFLRAYPALDFALLLFAAALFGLATGGCLSLPYSMLADTLDMEELETGKRKEGVYFGAITFMYKFAQALLVFLMGMLLGAIGFDADLRAQTQGVALVLGLILPGGALAAFGLSILFFRRYGLDKARIRAAQEEIARRKGEP